MKNKDIEELLNNIKDKYSYEPYDTTGKVYTTISYEEGQLLLSYIEQLEDFKKEHLIMKQILIENGLWEKLLNDDRFIKYLEEGDSE